MKRVLIADDSVAARKSIQTVLEAAGIEVVAVGNGDLALSRLREVDPDIVLLDAIMPGRSGYEVCREIKDDPANTKLPVVLITTEFEPYDEQAAGTAGADGHVLKPIDSAGISMLQKVWARFAASDTDSLEAPPGDSPAPAPQQFPGPESFITGTMKAPMLDEVADTVPAGTGRRRPSSSLQGMIARPRPESWNSPLPDHVVDENPQGRDEVSASGRVATTENLDIEIANEMEASVGSGPEAIGSISIDDLHSTSKRCPSCNAALVSGDIFCIACGMMVLVTSAEQGDVPPSVFCTGCGQEIIPGEIFCVSCGAVI
ncbi:MAG TPA: response regulator [Blastocatellia bacterium]|nr:response regulator [Blastocatellia bacterium]